MQMPKRIRLMPGEFYSTRFPGYVEKPDGTLRKRATTRSGISTNYYFVLCACEQCKKEFLCNYTNFKRSNRNFCSNACAGAMTSRVEGKKYRKFRTHGCVMVANRNHPMATKDGFVAEHRLVMEEEIGRFLKRGEVVHHINMVEDDNRVENLHLFPSNSEHHTSHGTINKLVSALIKSSFIWFDRETETYKAGPELEYWMENNG